MRGRGCRTQSAATLKLRLSLARVAMPDGDGDDPTKRTSRILFKDAVSRVIDANASEGTTGKAKDAGASSSSSFSSFWQVAKEMQRRAAKSRQRSSANRYEKFGAKPLPVFFDKDGRTGASAVWWRDARAVTAALDGDSDAASAAEDSDLAHATRATLFFAQDMSRELLYDMHVATRSLSFWEMIRDRPNGQARFLLLSTGPRNFVALSREGLFRFWCHARAIMTGKEAKFALPSASARVIIDGRVNALSELQVSLASVVGQVHHHADAIANSSGTGFHSREETRRTLMEATEGLLECLEQAKKYSTRSSKVVGDLVRVSSSSSLKRRDSPKLLKSLSRLSTGVSRARDLMPDLPEPTPRSPRASEDGGNRDTPSDDSPARPLSRLHRMASMDLSNQAEDESVQHRFRQPLIVDGKPLPLPKVNDTLWQALKRVEAEWMYVRNASHEALSVHEKPAKHVRRWIVYTFGAATLLVGTAITVRHSRLCGSDDLDNMISAAKSAIITFMKTRLLDPVKELRDELKAAFVSDRPDDALERLEESKASLDRMLGEYTKQASRPGYSESLYRAYKSVGGGSTEEIEGKEVVQQPDPTRLVTARVEEELKSPLTNMLAGDLMQLLLLQTQVMKVEMESALLQMDQLMRANRLNFSLMACFPAALGMYGSVLTFKAYLSMSFFRQRAKKREEMRLLLSEAERALSNLRIAERRSVQQGMLIYALNALYLTLQRHQDLFSKAEWRSVRADVLELADPSLPVEHKLVTIARLGRTKALIPEPHRVRHL